MADVYWGKDKSGDESGKYQRFSLRFFPQIMEGPISRYSDVSDTLFSEKPLELRNLAKRIYPDYMGAFKKKIVADRLAVAVEWCLEHYTSYSGLIVAVSAVAYTVQLYMEFSGCMDMIIGSGELFGSSSSGNFRQPFCARNAAEFWRKMAYYTGSMV